MSVKGAFRIIIDDSRVMLRIVATRVVIYNCNVLKVQATGVFVHASESDWHLQKTSLLPIHFLYITHL